MNTISKTLVLLPTAVILGFGLSIFYLIIIMYYVTGHLPDVSGVMNHLSNLEQIVTALGG